VSLLKHICCNSGDQDHCWNNNSNSGTEVIVGTHCCNSGNQDFVGTHCCNNRNRGNCCLATVTSDNIIAAINLHSIVVFDIVVTPKPENRTKMLHEAITQKTYVGYTSRHTNLKSYKLLTVTESVDSSPSSQKLVIRVCPQPVHISWPSPHVDFRFRWGETVSLNGCH
jgi:hypothetical protein